MNFFRISEPIKQVGPNKYVIGDNPLAPLLTLDNDTVDVPVNLKIANIDFKDYISGLNIDINLDQVDEHFNISGAGTGNVLVWNGTDYSWETQDSLDVNLNQVGEYLNITGAETGHFLTWNGSGYSWTPQTRFDLDTNQVDEHLNLSGAQQGYFLMWDGSGYSWTSQTQFNLKTEQVDEHLNLTGAQSGNVLTWNGMDYAWVPEKIQEIPDNYSSGRYTVEEAFELDEEGDIVPSNAQNVSDPMWILRNENDLELRHNLWRYNTGPEAFTDEISF